MDECLECCNCCNEYYNNCKDKKKFNEYKKYKHDHIKIQRSFTMDECRNEYCNMYGKYEYAKCKKSTKTGSVATMQQCPANKRFEQHLEDIKNLLKAVE